MNTNSQAIMTKRTVRKPLFASPWMALFLIIRREWLPSRTGQ